MKFFSREGKYAVKELRKMMLIDVHTHAYDPKDLDMVIERTSLLDVELPDSNPHKWRLHHEGTVETLVEEEKSAGIDQFVILPVSSKPQRVRELNQWVTTKAGEYPQVIPFGTLLPQSPTLTNDLDWVVSMGIRGIKIHPFLQRLDILSSSAHRLWGLLQETNRLLVLDTMCLEGLLRFKPHLRPIAKVAGGFEADPYKIASLAKTYPRLRVIAAHLGALYGWERLDPLYRCDNVYFDLSFVPSIVGVSEAMKIISQKGSDHILFGTDAPWRQPREVVRWFEALPLSSEEREQIGWKNFRCLWGTERREMKTLGKADEP